MPLDISWKTYLPKKLVPVSFINSELAADPKGMTKKWTKGVGCDVTLIVDDVRMLPCHREVLENLGGNVQEVLRNNEDPRNYKEIHFQDMDVEFVSSLTSYAYTGKITITTENVLGTIDGSSKCQIQFIQDRCIDFLIDNINRVDYLSLLVVADERGWIKLREAMFKHCVTHFSDIIELPEFLRITPGLLLEMLRTERLLVGDLNDVPPPHIQEKRVWEAVRQHIDHNPDERSGYLIGFLQHIRLPLMDRTDLVEIEETVKQFDDEDVTYLIAKAKKVRATIDAPLQDEDTIVWKRPRKVTPLRLMVGQGFADRKFGIIKTYAEDPFDDVFSDPWVHVTALKVTFRTFEKTKFILSSLRLTYSNGYERVHGTEYPSSVYNIKLDPEERIIQISGGAGLMIDRMQFLSNKGRTFGPYGGKGGNPITDAPPKSIYCHLAGVSGTTVDTEGGHSCRRVKFKWAYYHA